MTGNKTNESSEAYLDSLLSQMLSSADTSPESADGRRKMHSISGSAKEQKAPENSNEIETETAVIEDTIQSSEGQEIGEDVLRMEAPKESDAAFLEASDTSDTFEEAVTTEEAALNMEAFLEDEPAGVLEASIPEESDIGSFETAEISEEIEKTEEAVSDMEQSFDESFQASGLEEETGIENLSEEAQIASDLEIPLEAGNAVSEDEDFWDTFEEEEYDEYEEFEEWKDDTDMKEDIDFDLLDLPEASELDQLEETDLSREFHMEDQSILDEIEQELSGILPKRKEKRERRQKKEVHTQPAQDTKRPEEKTAEPDTAFSEENQQMDNLKFPAPKEDSPVMEAVEMDGLEEFGMDNRFPGEDAAALETEDTQTKEDFAFEMEKSESEGDLVPEMNESEKPSELEPEELDLSDMNLFDEGTDSLGEVSEDLDALFSEDNQEMKEDEKKAMDENDGFDLDSLFAASDDGFGEGLSEGGNETPDGDMDDLFGMLDMADGESTQEAAPDLFAKEEGNENDIFALDNGDADEDIFALDGMEEPEAKEEEKLPDPDNVFGESLAAVGFEEGAGETAQEKEGEKGGKKKKKAKKEKDGTSLFTKLFGNIIDKKSKQQFEAEQKAEADAEFKRSEKQRIKEGRLTEEEKAAEAAKEAEEAKLKEEKAAAKEAKKKAAEEKKAEKEAKKKAKREALEAEAAKEVDEGRINRVGAGIVFAFFGAVAAGVVVGTNLYTYSQSISRATEYFDVQKYNNAYKEVYGLDIKEKDETIYNKIMTVMFVNKELNSYNNFYAIGLYPEALDSLLKGLERYDKYLQDAESLGIESDLNYVRRQILGELKRSFSMTEKDAAELNAIKEQEEYSERIRKKAFAGNE